MFKKRHKRRLAVLRGIVPVIGLGIATMTVIETSNAAFSTTTDSTTDLTAGTVIMNDDDGGSALILWGSLVPNDTITRCLTVTYSGTTYDLSPVRMYGTSTTDTNSVSQYIDMTVVEGSFGANTANEECTNFTANPTEAIFSGTLQSFTTTKNNYDNGVVTNFTPTASAKVKSFKVTVTMKATTPDSVQGSKSEAKFTWEVRTA